MVPTSVPVARLADLNAWYRHPANVTGRQILAEAERRGWKARPGRGDHVVLRSPRTGRTIALDLGVKADGTKRAVVKAMIDDEE